MSAFRGKADMALCGNSLSRSLLGVKRTWQLHILKVRSEADFDAAFADIKRLPVGVLAATLNFIPYLGAAIVIAKLFVVGLIVFPTLGHAVIAPLAYLGITALEGHFITPTLIGHRLTINPFLVFLSIACWTWMWGPVGTFLAVPILLCAMVAMRRLSSTDVENAGLRATAADGQARLASAE